MRRLMLLATASLVLTLATTFPAARAAEGESHGGEHGPSRSVQTPHAPPNSGARVENRGGVRIAPKEIPHEGGTSIFGGTEHRPDGWRYRYENGAWWYWMPNNHWTYYDNGGWQDYTVATPEPALPVSTDPNFYWYKDQWWYLMPGNHWSIYDHGHWRDGPAGMAPPRREGAVHGEPKGEIRKDEHGPHAEGPEGKRK